MFSSRIVLTKYLLRMNLNTFRGEILIAAVAGHMTNPICIPQFKMVRSFMQDAISMLICMARLKRQCKK